MDNKHLHCVDPKANLLPVIFPNLGKDDLATKNSVPFSENLVSFSDQTMLMKEVDPNIIFGPKIEVILNQSKVASLDKTGDMCGKLPTIIEDAVLEEFDDPDQTTANHSLLYFFDKLEREGKVWDKDFSTRHDLSTQDVTVPNASQTCIIGSNDNKNTFGKPHHEFTSTDSNFAPLDVANGHENSNTVYAVCQVTNTVGVFKDGKFDVLRTPTTKYFHQPRNILTIPSDKKVFVLDSKGIHAFHASGDFIGTLLKGQGYKYRGLSYYKCKSQTDFITHLVTLDVSNSKKHGTFLCVFGQSPQGFQELSRIPITAIADPVKSQCRFVSVFSLCTNEHGCIHHIAYITDSGDSAVYRMDIKSKKSRTFSLKRNPSNPETTFLDDEGDVNLMKPTGVCVDAKGNVYVADKDKSKIEIFCSGNFHIRTVRLHFPPLGISFYKEPNLLLAADLEGKIAHVIDLD